MAQRVATSEMPGELLSGYREFVAQRLPIEQARFAELAARGQSPKVLLIGCCDSRVPPEVIFNARPGQLFVVRNVANLVPPYRPDGEMHGTGAALEYAVQALKVEHIVVLGHRNCGGIRAFAERNRKPLSPGDFVGRWVSVLQPAARLMGEEGLAEVGLDEAACEDVERYAARLEVASLRQSLINLRTFPCIRILESRGRIQLHAAHFDVSTGILSWLDPADGRLMPIPDNAGQRDPFAPLRGTGCTCCADSLKVSATSAGMASPAGDTRQYDPNSTFNKA